MTAAGRHVRRTGRCPGPGAVVVAAVLAALSVAAMVSLDPASSAFSGTVTSPAGQVTASATFPTYPAMVTALSPWAYYRGDDAPSASSGSTAADAMSSHAGKYSGATDGSVTRWQFDENTGTRTADSSGAANTGTLGSSAGWTGSGKYNAALSLNGTANAYVTGASAAVHTDASFTVSAWVYLTSNAATATILSQPGTHASGFDLQFSATTGKWHFKVGNADADATAVTEADGGTVTLNSWTFVLATYDDSANQIKLYTGGTLRATTSYTAGWDATGALQVGRAWWDSAWTNPFPGRIDSLRVYPFVLSGTDISAIANGTYADSVQGARAYGALQGAQQGQRANGAMAFTGSTNGYSNNTQNNPQVYTIECWFRTASTTGGVLVGFGQSQTGNSTNHDRIVYIDSGNRLTFGNWGNTNSDTVRSTATYNDGVWHYLVASLGAAGMRLYVDSALVASDASVTNAQSLTGYWRWGGEYLYQWPNRPSDDYLTGAIDELAIYTTQLTAQQIIYHYHANH